MKAYVTEENDNQGPSKQRWLLGLLVLGFVMVAMGLILVALAMLSQTGQASFGGVIFIGPFPIVFGAGPGSQWLVPVAISLAVMMLIMLLIIYRKHLVRQV